MTRARGSLSRWEFRPLCLPKQPCVFKSSKMLKERNEITKLSYRMGNGASIFSVIALLLVDDVQQKKRFYQICADLAVPLVVLVILSARRLKRNIPSKDITFSQSSRLKMISQSSAHAKVRRCL